MATYTDNYSLTKPTFAEVADIRTINGNMDTIDDIMHASQVSLADAYDQTATYNTGDVVMYEFLMYKCKEDNVTGNWDATKWERTTAAETGGEASDLSVKVPEVISTGNKACYVKRAIPTAGALAEGQKIVGATLAWNQLVQNGNFATTSGWVPSSATFSVSGNKGLFTATAQWGRINGNNISIIADHKYLMSITINGTTDNYYGVGNSYTYYCDTNGKKTYNKIFNASNSESPTTQIGDRRSSGWTQIEVEKFNVIDLTQLFGSTIADAIYQMEQTTAGSGVAFFRQYFSEDHYDYEIGKLESVNVSAHKAVGFNQWDEDWEQGGISGTDGTNIAGTDRFRSKNYITVIPNNDYYFACTSLTSGTFYVCFYTPNKSFIERSQVTINSIYTIPANCGYIRFFLYNQTYGNTYKGDICINLSKTTGSPKNGDYVPYNGNTETLDSSKELRGLYELVSGELRANGDVYEADGTVTRKYGIVDLGSLNWTYESGEHSRMWATIAGIKRVTSTSVLGNLICPLYTTDSVDHIYTHNTDKTIGVEASNYRIWIYDTSYNDAAAFKTAMNGVYLVYELATPTTESATPYTNPQIVDADGTEEFVDYKVSQGTRDVAIPVGHESSFYDYTDGSITIPDLPFADGTYALSVTMNNGTPTFSWEGGN